jgi:3-methyladenine DNA glycosylase AlkC
MEPLKEMFNKKFYQKLSDELAAVDKIFDPKKFYKAVTHQMEPLSLNERLRNTSIQMKKHLPHDYRKNITMMKKVAEKMPKGYTALIYPDYIGLYGHEDREFSLEALAYFTSFGSSEFAIREFLKRNLKPTLKTMESWADNKSDHIRRLASEGSRPRLPWSFKLDEIIKDPNLTRNILEKLNADTSLYVRKSVANHLNDFSKDHPEYMLGVVSKWNKENDYTAWIVKHACRTLIKKGNEKALGIFSFDKNIQVKLNTLTLNKEKITLGDRLEFDFTLASQSKKSQKLVVDYCIHYFKKNGTSPKVFKFKEIVLQPGEKRAFKKTQLFVDLTTRKHYPGKHVLEILVNGNVLGSKEFMLKL